MSKQRQFLAILASLVVITLAGCNKESTSTAPKQAQESNTTDPNLVTVTPEINAEIKVSAVGSSQIRQELRIPGSIQVNEQRVAKIGAPVTGRITDIEAFLGQIVKQGQTLASLNSTELAQNQLVYIKARQQISLQTKAVDRAKLLFSSDVISAAEVQKRESELSGAVAEANAARDQLLILGMSKASITQLENHGSVRSISNVEARIAGTIIDRKVTLGQVVQPADALFTIADLSHIWAVAKVPEQQIDLIRKDEEVDIEIPALGNKLIKGKLIFIGDVVDPLTRTVTVRTDIDNAEHQLKPDMLASMLVQSKPVDKTAIPETAIFRENNKDHVFVKVAPNQYRLREVTLGTHYQNLVAVNSGLNVGEIIVSDGAFHLNNERKRKELE